MHAAGLKARSVGVVIGVVGSMAVHLPAQAGPDVWAPVPDWAPGAAVVMLVILIGGPWAVSSWILLRRFSATARSIGALYAIGSALVLFIALRDPPWPSIGA